MFSLKTGSQGSRRHVLCSSELCVVSNHRGWRACQFLTTVLLLNIIKNNHSTKMIKGGGIT